MGILDFLKRKPEATASVARERLRIIVAQERSTRGAPSAAKARSRSTCC